MNYIYNTNRVDQTWLMLKVVYAAVPIILGLDKLLAWWIVDWAKYASPTITYFLPLTVYQFVLAIGIIEIIAGLVVWFYPRFGGYLVAVWMMLIVVDLLTMGGFYDIAARDVVIAIGALALAWLSEAQELRK